MKIMKDQFRVLIVDDHREMRTAFKANLEALEGNVEVIDVPSGEEAILETAAGEIDLLIADIGLPGLSGLELFERLKKQDPEVKVILVTGQEDEDIRRQIADCGADAFFIKPVNLPDFLGAVRRCLGLKEIDPAQQDLPELSYRPLDEGVTERIAELRGEVGALSVAVINDNGLIAGQVGSMPDAVYESKVLPRLLDTFQAVNDISGFLGIENPDSSWYFSGIKYDIFWTIISPAYGMVVITNPIMQNTDLTWVITTVDMAASDLLKIIRELPEKQPLSRATAPGPSREQESAETVDDQSPEKVKAAGKGERQTEEEEPVSGEESIEQAIGADEDPVPVSGSQFAQKFSEVVGKDVDEYWEEATLESEISTFEDAESLSYEEARKLGFIPEED